MSARIPICLIFCLLLSGVSTAADAAAASLEAEMSAAEFKAAGLDKLTPAELERLNQWIQQTRQRDVPGLTTQSPDIDTRTVTGAAAASTSPPIAVDDSVARAAAQARELEAAQAAAETAQSEAETALAAAQAAEARARAQAQEASARQAAAEAEAAKAQAAAAARQAEAAELAENPFQQGRWVGPKPDQVNARIAGEFRGWEGDTLFMLDNGEVWKQRTRGLYIYKADNPEVRITRNALGFFMLEVVETGKSVGVKRVR